MKSYHFDCGNSNNGPIGMCAVVKADSKEEACQILNDSTPDDGVGVKLSDPTGRIVYVRVYFGNVEPKDIDEVDDE